MDLDTILQIANYVIQIWWALCIIMLFLVLFSMWRFFSKLNKLTTDVQEKYEAMKMIVTSPMQFVLNLLKD